MAARTKDSAHGEEKTSSSHSQGMDTPHGKRTPKPSIAEPPEKDSSLLAEKPKPNYLKPTISSGLEASKYVKKQTSESQAPKRLVRKSSLDKPHSSTSQPQKTQVSASFREKPTKTSSPTPKTATYVRTFSDKMTTSSKTVSDKATKTVRDGKTQPSTKLKIIKREPCFPRKRENKTPSTVTTAYQETEKPPSICDEQEEKETENVQVQGFKVEDEDLPGMQPNQDHTPTESVEYEPETPENENVEALESVTPSEDHLEDCKTEVEGIKENEIDEDNWAKQNGEQRETTDKHDDGHHTRNSEENGIVDEEQQKSSEEKKATMDNQEEQSTHNSEEAREVTDKEYEKEGIEKITSKEREEAEMAEITDMEYEKEGIEKINSKEREEADMAKATNPVPDSTSLEINEEKVKKDSPDYNDVIEETASKLVEKRKNRVLALAGAFETAITLHESTVQGKKGRE